MRFRTLSIARSIKGTNSSRSLITLGACLAIVASACSSATHSGSSATTTASSGKTVTLRVGYIPSLTAAGVPAVGQALGLWSKVPGVRFDFVPFTTGPAQTEALAGGSIDLENIGGGPAMLGVAGYGKIVAVDNVLDDNYIIGQTHDSVTSVAALRDKSVGYPEGTTAQLLLAVALHQAGMSMSDIRAINMQPATIVSAMTSNQIQAAAIYLPFAASILSNDAGTKVIARLSDYPSLVLPQFWVASNSILQHDPQAVKAFLKVAAVAIDYRAAHLRKAVQDVFAFTKAPSAAPFEEQAKAEDWITSKQILADYRDGQAEAWVANLIRDMGTYGIKETSVPASSLTDFSLDESVLTGGGSSS